MSDNFDAGTIFFAGTIWTFGVGFLTSMLFEANGFDLLTGSFTALAAIPTVNSVLAYRKAKSDLLQKEADLRQQEAAMEQREAVLRRREETLSKSIFSVEKEFNLSFSELGDLINSTNSVDSQNNIYYSRARKYIDRLKKLNNERREAFAARPLLTVASATIDEKKQFSQTREEFLIREQALCKSVAESKCLVIPFSTQWTPCQVIRVIDGDTVDVQVNEQRVRIRLVGYNTPEVCSPSKPGYEHWGIQASEAAQKIISEGTVFSIRLDSVGFQKSWNSDRYGRVLAHIAVDGVLLGLKMLQKGDADLVDAFPIEDDVLQLYKNAEYDAKINDFGMWADINRYKLTRKPIHQQRKWNLPALIENRNERTMTQELLRDVLKDMLGSVIFKSKRSVVLHKDGCHHVNRISDVSKIELSEEWLESNSNDIRPCKLCGGDELVREMMG
jgi:endonuclease YncB( thermonuclease family)